MTMGFKIFLSKCLWIVLASSVLLACNDDKRGSSPAMDQTSVEEEFQRGPNGGRLLESGEFTLELAIFETGVPPEFHAWATIEDNSLPPGEINLTVTLTRLGNVTNTIHFTPQGGYLRGDTVVYEPHSFVVSVEARYRGELHIWEYDNFEGRTTINSALSRALGINTSLSGPAVLEQYLSVVGETKTASENIRHIFARFDGLVLSVSATLGEYVTQGDPLLTIESNDSLNQYAITVPISGVITQRNVNPGEQTNTRMLFEIMDTSTVWADLAIFPGDRSRVLPGASVTISSPITGQSVQGTIENFNMTVGANQTLTARVLIENRNGLFSPGTFVAGKINTGQIPVPLAVKRTALQSFRDFTVVYAKIGNDYEVRMLELGRQDDQWIEILGGLEPGTEYVSENSYIIKADIEKSGASHDH